jgi:PAS domain S-box-containing protein
MQEQTAGNTGAQAVLNGDVARISAELVRLNGGTDPFAAAVRATRMPMIITDPRQQDNPVVFTNDSFCRLTGYAREEILGRNCRFLQGPETDRAVTRRIRDAVAQGVSIEIDIRNYRKSGETFWNRLLLAPVRDAAGEIAYFFASQVDVTLERERLENLEGANAALTAEVADRTRALAASEERMRQLADNVREVFYIIDTRNGTVEYVSPAYQQIWGRSVTELYQDHDSFIAAIRPADRDSVRAAIRKQRRGEPTEQRYRVLQADGTERRIWDRAWPLRDEAGEVYRVVGVAEDETDRALAEERLATSELKLRQVNAMLRELNEDLEARIAERTLERDLIWRTSIDLIVVCGFDGICRSANPAWREILLYPPEEIVGSRLDGLLHPDDLHAGRAAFEKLAAGEAVRDLDLRIHTADGAYRSINWSATPQEDVFFAVGRDVTDRKRLEEELRQSQKMEAVGQLTGGLAHDFNNLLTGITGGLELLETRLAQGRASDAARYIAAAQGAAKRAAALTHRLLAFSRRQTLEPKPTDANRLIGGLEDLVKRTVGPGIAVSVVGAPDLWPILVDANQLENALLNLCINARDAMPDGGKLLIETSNRELDERGARTRDLPPGAYVSLCVTDTGAGMPPEVIARAFDPFFTTKPIGQGTGLGLSMVYGFVRQSGGQVRIHSQVGDGTSVCLFLPRHGIETESEHSAQDSGRFLAGQGERVLVVDDEPTVRMLIADVLDELGYGPIEAEDGASGLEILRAEGRIDLLITDVGLPGGMNGRQLADAGRALRPGLRVLFITGYAESAVVNGGNLETGMQVLTKPFPMDELTRRIREMLATD